MPTESARNSRKLIRNSNEPVSRSAGNATGSTRPVSSFGNGFNLPASPSKHHSSTAPRLDQQSQEYIKNLSLQLRNPDFRERIDAIEKFQVACETATEMVVANIVQVIS